MKKLLVFMILILFGSITLLGCSGGGGGKPTSTSRFRDNGDGTITDNRTGLMWKATPLAETNWEGALNAANDLVFPNGGYNDWRLPNINELFSLINTDVADQAEWLNSNGFQNIGTGAYWTSTTRASDPFYAFLVNMKLDAFTDTESFIIFSEKGSPSIPLLAVRGNSNLPKTGQISGFSELDGEDGDLQMGIAWPSPRFIDNGNGEVIDIVTNLIWQQAPNGLKTWTDAVNGAPEGWRLPSYSEIRTLINYNATTSADWLNTRDFTGISIDAYWTTTALASNPTKAVCIYLESGEFIAFEKTESRNTWYVKGP